MCKLTKDEKLLENKRSKVKQSYFEEEDENNQDEVIIKEQDNHQQFIYDEIKLAFEEILILYLKITNLKPVNKIK